MSLGERAYEAVVAAVAAAAPHLPWVSGKWRAAAAARRGALSRIGAWAAEHRDRSRPLVWMHAASVGEGLQAKPVLERLRAERPDVQVFYTYFSPSAGSWVARLPADGADILPYDRAPDAEAALSALEPDALVFSKLDVWPVLTRAAKRRGVALGLVSGTVAPSSGRLRRPARWALRDAYARLDRAGAIDAGDAERLVRLGVHPDRVVVTGDARFDQVWARVRAIDRGAPPVAPLLDAGRPTLVAGSTWPEDEGPLLAAVAGVRRTRPQLRLLLVPHEPERARVETLLSRLRRAALSAERYSAWAGGPWDALVVDRVGILGELYAAGDLAFVGGAFGRRGIHSVLEPAAVGLPILFGPRHGSAREAAALAAAGAAFPAATAAELEAALARLVGEPAARRRAGETARRYVGSNVGAADRNARLMLDLLGR